jgi:hypothetical protein
MEAARCSETLIPYRNNKRGHSLEDDGCKVVRNVGILPQHTRRDHREDMYLILVV